MADEDDASKTEQPTSKRLTEAEKKGDQAKSAEISHFFALVGSLAAMAIVLKVTGASFGAHLAGFIDHAAGISLDGKSPVALVGEVAIIFAQGIGIPLMLLAFLGVASHRAQNKIIFSPEKLMPDWSKVSPIAGLKRLFSRRGLIEFVKGIAKMTLVGAGAIVGIWPSIRSLTLASERDPAYYFPLVFHAVLGMFGGALTILAFIAVGDYFFQYFERLRRLRMTKHEVKDENKQQEGDPLIKGKRRRIQREQARKRMFAAVPTASVVITNPTHFAVALKYNGDTMAAPRLIAKGQDLVAARIRALAEEHGVPLVENPPLARTLHASVEVDEEIPPEHYRAVAEIIGFIMRRRSGPARGQG